MRLKVALPGGFPWAGVTGQPMKHLGATLATFLLTERDRGVCGAGGGGGGGGESGMCP